MADFFNGIITFISEGINSTFITEDRWIDFLLGLGNTMLITLGAVVIGVVLGFTKTRVIVGLDYTANGYKLDSELTQVKVAPYNLTKVINQNIGLRDYFKLRNDENKSRTSYEIEN